MAVWDSTCELSMYLFLKLENDSEHFGFLPSGDTRGRNNMDYHSPTILALEEAPAVTKITVLI